MPEIRCTRLDEIPNTEQLDGAPEDRPAFIYDHVCGFCWYCWIKGEMEYDHLYPDLPHPLGWVADPPHPSPADA